MKFELALITGASGGLGKALCRLLASKGIAVLPITRKECDLAKDRTPLLKLIEEKAPDLVINNAGFCLYGPALDANQKDVFEVNAAAAIEISIEAARALRSRNKPGAILNVSSIAGDISAPSMAVYAAAKAAVTSFSRSFDAEMRPYGIRILAGLPGSLDTPFASRQKPYRHPFAISPDACAEAIWRQIERGQTVCRIGWIFRLLRLLSLLAPRLSEAALQKELSKRY